jgi:predicted nucleic acid-binding protein
VIKIEDSNEKEFIQSEFSFKVDSIERLSRQVLIHVYESDSSFYAPYLLLYEFTDHQDSVVKKKNVNGFYIYKFEYDYKLPIFLEGYD